VAQNIHAGEYVDRDHRRNLLQVVIGHAGITLAKRVDELDAAIREKTGEITTARRTIQRAMRCVTRLSTLPCCSSRPISNTQNPSREESPFYGFVESRNIGRTISVLRLKTP
jgi:hypothetical protein